MNSVRKSVSRGTNSQRCHHWKVLALLAASSVLGACTSLPGPPGDPGKYKQTRVDGPGKLSKVAYGRTEKPRNLPKTAWGNAPTYTVFGQQYSVMDTSRGFREQGVASWYGSKFHGRQTSSGEVYNMYNMTAAHKHLPLPTFVRVTNLENNKQLVVKVNDRGPFVDDRIIDLSYGAAARLGMLDTGTARVAITAISENIEKPPVLQAKAQPAVAKSVKQVPLASSESQTRAPAQYVEILASAQGGGKQVLPASEVVRQPRPVVRREAPTEAVLAAPPSSIAGAAVINSGTVIQVGAFGNPANAESMRLRVNRAVNDEAAIVTANSRGTLLRVQIGPLPAEAPIERIVSQLRSAGIKEFKMFEL